MNGDIRAGFPGFRRDCAGRRGIRLPGRPSHNPVISGSLALTGTILSEVDGESYPTLAVRFSGRSRRASAGANGSAHVPLHRADLKRLLLMHDRNVMTILPVTTTPPLLQHQTFINDIKEVPTIPVCMETIE